MISKAEIDRIGVDRRRSSFFDPDKGVAAEPGTSHPRAVFHIANKYPSRDRFGEAEGPTGGGNGNLVVGVRAPVASPVGGLNRAGAIFHEDIHPAYIRIREYEKPAADERRRVDELLGKKAASEIAVGHGLGGLVL